MAAWWVNLRPAVPGVLLGTLVLLALFFPEATAALHVWNTSTAYGHCWLVLPLAAWLFWERREVAGAVAPRPLPALALLCLPVAAVWLGADLLGIMEGRQLAAIACVEILLLAALGARLWWALSAAFLYLIFLVPFGAFITPALQDFTAGFVARGLDFLQIPSRVTAYRIEIPEGQFYVAEACAGLRFLIASIAFGVLYAVTMFRSCKRRAVFIAASMAVPVVANGFRALGIVLLGHILGSAQAAETDHVLYGWIFFSIVIFILALSGMPFRQEPLPPPGPIAAPRPGAGRRAAIAAGCVAVLAAAGPLAGFMLAGEAAAHAAAPVLLTPPTCTLTGSQSAGSAVAQQFRCGDARLTTWFEVLPHRANPARIVDTLQTRAGALLADRDLDGGTLDVPGISPGIWLLERGHDHRGASAASLFVDGAPALGGLKDRWHMMQDMLTGSGKPAAALAVAVTGGGNPESILREFLSAQGNLNERIAAATR